jgi:tetratricopeptide (TPR) repeat protein
MNSDSLKQQINRYESFVKADPQNTLIWLSLGDLYHKGGLLEKAESCFANLLQIEPNNEVAKGRLANVALSQHDFCKVEEIIKSIPDYQHDRALINNLGIALCHQEKWQEAKQLLVPIFQDGVTHQEIPNLKYLIYALHHCEEEAHALEVARSWYRMDESIETRGLIALLEMDLGDMQIAHIHAEEVLQRNPENANANMVAGFWQTGKQEIDTARRHFQKVLAADPNNERGWQGLGLSFMYDQNFPEARKCFLRFQTLSPDHVTNYILLGWNEMALQNPIEAEKYFRQAIETDRTFGEAHGGLASALAMQNKLEEARGHIEKARGLDAEGFGAVYAHSISLHLKGKPEMGTKIFAKMLERTPNGGDKPLIENLQTFFKQQDLKQKRLKVVSSKKKLGNTP